MSSRIALWVAAVCLLGAGCGNESAASEAAPKAQRFADARELADALGRTGVECTDYQARPPLGLQATSSADCTDEVTLSVFATRDDLRQQVAAQRDGFGGWFVIGPNWYAMFYNRPPGHVVSSMKADLIHISGG